MDLTATRHDAADSRRRFAAVVLPHLPAARRVARRYTRNCEDADEVAQEAAIRMLRFIDSYRGGDARSWVMSVARNTALSWLRKHRRHEHVSLDDHEELPCDACPTPPEDLEALRRALEGLPAPYREIVSLRHFNELSYTEISVALDVPVGTVMSRLFRARAQLRGQL